MDKCQEKIKELAIGFHGDLECPVCFVQMDSTLKLCKLGHGVCSSCVGNVEKCPTCRQDFASEIDQNTLLGKLLERLPKLCPYTDKGCDTAILDREHQMYCEYRPTRCLKTSCDWEGCVKDLLDHVRSCDKGVELCEVSLNRKQSKICTFEINESKDFFAPIILKNQVFWKHFQRNSETKCINHQLFVVPTSKPSCDYYLVVSFSRGGIKFEHSCKAEVYLNGQRENEVKTGLTIPDGEMKRFLVEGKENEYEFTLKMVKEEFL